MESTPQTLVDLILPVLADLTEQELPALVAAVEILLAAHYKRLAKGMHVQSDRQILLDCAVRELSNAEVVHELLPDKEQGASMVLTKFPDLPTQLDELFARHTVIEQLQLLADGEANGAEIYKDLAKREVVPEASNKLGECALAEQENVYELQTLISRLS